MTRNSTAVTGSRGVWSEEEHERFREALELYPDGPWKAVAEFVGTRTVRQVQTHAQKYHEKAARQLRNLRLNRARQAAPTMLIDFEMQGICADLQRHRVPLSPRSSDKQARSIEPFVDTETQSAPWFDECLDFLIDSLEANPMDAESSFSGYTSSGGGGSVCGSP
jgi:SHAQKYF class myb-like DNA-binding protein